MAARGAESKQIITKKILEIFPNSFQYDNKEIRIPMIEDGAEVQIKVTLTAAKTNVSAGNDNAIPTLSTSSSAPSSFEITPEEKKEVDDLITSLNL